MSTINQRQRNYIDNNGIGNAAVPLSTRYLNGMTVPSGHPPPLPPRRTPYAPGYSRYPGASAYQGMSNYYSPYSRFPSSLYSPGYGNCRMSPYGQYGASSTEPNAFVQMAEESTRPAFESIESVVEVVSSISMMLESTYHAVHSSYSAILGVVDQFSRLKDHLAHILSVLTLVRGLRWLCLKVLYLLRLRKDNPSVEAAWNSAEQFASDASGLPGENKGSAWPFLMFVGLVIGAPWLMFKLLSKNMAKKPADMRLFTDENGRRYLAFAAFDFDATQPGELSFRSGEKLYIAVKSYQSKTKGWMLACNQKQETGLIPANYLARQKSAASSSHSPNAASQSQQPASDKGFGVGVQTSSPSVFTPQVIPSTSCDESLNSEDKSALAKFPLLPDCFGDEVENSKPAESDGLV